LQHELIVLASIAENAWGPKAGVSYSTLTGELERLVYNKLALNLGLGGLIERDMVGSREEEEYDYNRGSFTFTDYYLEIEDMKWITRNYERLNLRVAPRSPIR
jgi:hypothetical protein